MQIKAFDTSIDAGGLQNGRCICCISGGSRFVLVFIRILVSLVLVVFVLYETYNVFIRLVALIAFVVIVYTGVVGIFIGNAMQRCK